MKTGTSHGLAVLSIVFFGAAASGQEAMREITSATFGQQSMRISYQSRAYFNEDTSETDTKLQLLTHDFRFTQPVYQDELNEVLFHVGLDVLDIDSNARIHYGPLKARSFQLPGELYDVRVGGTYRHKFENDWIAGMTLMLGSPSDQPFANADVWDVNATGFLRIPQNEALAWLIFLNYSINREFLQGAPIPGAAVEYAPARELTVLAGVPFSSVRWRPTEQWSIDASYFIPRQIRAEVGFHPAPPVKLYAGYYWDNQRFFRSNRADRDERLFYYEQRAMAGVRWDITENVWIDAGAGYAFNRYFFEAERWGDRNDARLNIADGPVGQFRVGVSF